MTLPRAFLAVLFSGVALAGQQQDPAKAAAPSSDAKVIAQQLPSYPLTTCPISEEPLESMGKAVDIVHEGHLVRFCCKNCLGKFKKDPAPVLKTIEDAVVAQQLPKYPLTTCPVSGDALSDKAVNFVQGTRLVRFCCKDCVEGFAKEPAKFMGAVDKALIADQKKTYPVSTCVVSGEALESGFDYLHGTRLVRFCCEKCVAEFQKEPTKYLALLDKANKKS